MRSPKRKRKATPVRIAKKRPVGRPPARTLTKLGKWLVLEGVTRADFAQKLQIERKSVDRLARGARRPSLELARRIELATNGKVSLAAWDDVPPHTRD